MPSPQIERKQAQKYFDDYGKNPARSETGDIR